MNLSHIWHFLAIYHWRDALEIIFFSTLFYYGACWLKQDKTKNLLPYLYGLCALTLCAHLLNLPTIVSSIFIFIPGLIAVFILMHQETLQRNIVALKNISTKKEISTNWHDIIMQVALARMNENKELHCVIGCSDDLLPFVSTPFLLNTPIAPYTINLLISSPSFDAAKMLWFCANGSIRGLNGTWNYAHQHKQGAQSLNEMWQTASQLFTQKTDAFAFRLDPETRLFTVIKQGIIMNAITAEHMHKLLRTHTAQAMKKNTHTKNTPSHKEIMK